MQSVVLLLVLVVPFLLVENARSRRNERTLRARGAIEPAADVHRWMQPVYPAMFLSMAIEGLLRGDAPIGVVALGATIFLLGKALKWAAILSLGDLWSFRVLVLPGTPLITSGPYRYFRHPNYIGVVGEMLGAATMWQAWIAGVVFAFLFGALLVRRIAEEERALGLRPSRDTARRD